MASSVVSPAKLGVLSLPVEILREICSHCSQSDLICLSLVCGQFHELAASQLYRNFHIVFPDEDDPTFDSPIDGLASGLDTFATSNYNYAKHLRDLSLDTLSAGGRAEQAYKPYLFKVSCGKFMNTLLLLTLRKASALETFKWNIRVELSRSVYKALHNIPSLKHFHVRMQSGHSLYETPPPLPWTSHFPATTGLASTAGLALSVDNTWTYPGGTSALYGTGANAPLTNVFSTAPGPFGFGVSPQYTTYAPPPVVPPPTFGSHAVPPTPSMKPASKSKGPKRQTSAKEPLTIAGFKRLQTFCVLDIDNLDVIPEIQTCIQSSSSQLRKLKLSFSDTLASQARKPKVEVDPSESDDDDEFQVVPMTTNYDDGSGPAKAFRAQEERRAQESVLGRLFQVEPFAARTVNLSKKHKREAKAKEPKEEQLGDRQRMFLVAIEDVSKRLSENTTHLASDAPKQKEILDLITAASKLYIDDVRKDAASTGRTTSQGIYIPPSWLPEAGPKSATDVGPEDGTKGEEEAKTEEDTVKASSKTYLHLRENADDTEPEDIDIAKPEEHLSEDSLEDICDDPTPRNEPSVSSTTIPTPTATNSSHGTPSQAGSAAPTVSAAKTSSGLSTTSQQPWYSSIEQGTVDQGDSDGRVFDFVKNGGEHTRATDMPLHSYEDVQHEINVMEAELEDAGEPALQITNDDEELQHRIGQYTRETRGIALKSLSIHLIPVKASVLGRAIDLRRLTRITLLNVGNQAPIWSLMAKENKVQNLPLRKIFTDNVSSPFLHLASQLESIEELFLLERGPKYKPESFAPKTDITLDQIRRAILKKHMPSIKRLMIKSQKEGDSSWDMDEKTMQLICKRGKRLEELAVATGIRAIHAFLQHLTGLANLRALHVISFRVDDTCLSVMRETRRFIVDTVSHYPEMQLEWIAMGDDNRADRIIRRTDNPRKPKKKQTKGKGKEIIPLTGLSLAAPALFPILPTDVWDDSSSESEVDDGENGAHPYLKLDLIEAICFYDIWGVRIFKKEVVAARL
ncbi:hypothetical protein SCAR479_12485 [Seiridium cardinale]|uniref:F-box domain-containing protein n=1 Tax=Seiridium cardinale TaxID=138064 RepID=A0ABR2XAJ0_9PEZI